MKKMTDLPPQNIDNNTPPNSGAPEPWYNVLPENLRAEQSIIRYNDIAKFAEAKLHLERHMGVPEDRLLKLPNADDAQAMGELYNRLGRPESFDKYTLQNPEGLPPLMPEREKKIREEFFNAGLTQAQVDRLWKLQADIGLEDMQSTSVSNAAEMQVAELELKSHWGKEYDNTMAIVQNFIGKEFDDKTLDMLEKTGLDKNPALIKVIGDTLRKFNMGGGLAGLGEGNGGRANIGGLTPSEALAQIAALRADEKFVSALTDKQNIGHVQALEKWKNLNIAAATKK